MTESLRTGWSSSSYLHYLHQKIACPFFFSIFAMQRQSKMKQSDFLSAVQQEAGLNAAQTREMTRQLVEALNGILADGDSLTVHGFGSFEVKKKEERLSVNPQSGKRFMIPPKLVPAFRPGASLKERIKAYQGHE